MIATFNRWAAHAAQVARGPSFLTLLGTTLRLGGGLLTLPIALRTIPQAELGLYYSFLSICAITMLFDFGFATTITRNAAYAMGGAKRLVGHGIPPGSEDGAPNFLLLGDLLVVVRRWYGILGIVLAIALLWGGTVFVRQELAKAGLDKALLGAWVLFAASQVYSFATGFWPNMLNGIGQVAKAARVGLVSQFVGLVILVTGLLLGWSIWSYGLSSLSAAIIGRFLVKHQFHATVGHLAGSPEPGAFQEVLRAMWPMAWRQGLVLIGTYLSQRGNTLISVSQFGLSETASYGLTLQLLALLTQVSRIPLIVALPTISRLRVSTSNREIWTVFSRRTYGGLAVGLLGLTVLCLGGPQILALIGSQTTLLPPALVTVFGIIILLEYHHVCYGELVVTENRNPFVIPCFLNGVGIILLSWILAERIGIAGLIYSQGIVQLLWLNWWPVKLGLKGLPRRTGVDSSITHSV